MSLALPYHLSFDGGGSGSNVTLDDPLLPKVATKQTATTARRGYFDSMWGKQERHGRRPEDVVQRMRCAIVDRDVAALHGAYAELRKTAIRLRQSGQPSTHHQAQAISSLTAGDMEAAMKVALGPPISFVPRARKLNKSLLHAQVDGQGKQSAANGRLVQQMFEDTRTLFSFSVTNLHCSASLASFALQRASPQAAFDHFLHLVSTFSSFSASWEDGMVVIGLSSKYGDVETAQSMWNYLMTHEVTIGSDLRDLYFSILLKTGRVNQARSMAFSGPASLCLIPLEGEHVFSLAWFLEGLCRAGKASCKQAMQIAGHLYERLQLSAAQSYQSNPLFEWHAVLIHTAMTKNGSAALEMVRQALATGLVKVEKKTFNILLLCHDKELRQMAKKGTEGTALQLFKDIGEACGVGPDHHSFSVGISALLGKAPSLLYAEGSIAGKRAGLAQNQTTLQSVLGSEGSVVESSDNSIVHNIPKQTPGQIHEATLLYEKFLSLGMVPDSAMVHPLINAHTNTYVPSVTKAIELYNDLRSPLPRQQHRKDNKVGESIYDVLLYACVRVRDMTTANRLLQDMIDDGISLSPSNQSNLAVLLMQASTSYDAAFQVYSHLRDASVAGLERQQPARLGVQGQQDDAPFGHHGWLRIIDCFSKLRFGTRNLAPVEAMLEMVRDMKRFGFAPNALLYTTFLHHYGRKATTMRDKYGVRSAVIALHSYLLYEETLEPDLALITALIDAYNRVDLTENALEVWNRLVLSRTQVDSACIAVVLDTCGRRGKLVEARRAWAWVRRSEDMQKQQCNKGVWDAWIECLARCGRLTEAIDAAFGEMNNELTARGEAGSDAKTFEMLLRFASAGKQRWTSDSDQEFATLADLKQRLCEEMPAVWEKVKMIPIPLE